MKEKRAVALLPAALLLAGLAALALPGARPRGGPRAEGAAELAWDAEAQRSHAAYRARNQRRAEGARAVAAGRMPLLEAAARFAALNRLPPEVRTDLSRLQYPGASEEERLCRDVIFWAVEEAALSDPCEAAALRGRLEAELGRRLRAGLRLPAVEEGPLLDGE
jgi:hypothetical protein